MNAIRLALQSTLFAIKQIFSHKIRSLLTTLGVIIGVSAVLAVVAALTGLRQGILDEFESFGVKRVFIDGNLPREMRNKINWRDVQLSLDEVNAIVERCPSIVEISPIYRAGGPIAFGDTKLEVGPLGIWPAWHDIENRQVILGRPFNSIDENERSSVCLINDKAVEELLLPTDPIGEIVLIAERRFKIVGVVETIQSSGMFGGGDTSAEVWVPLSTAQNLNPDGWVNMAWAQLKSKDFVEDAKAEIRAVLRQMRSLAPNDPDTFEIGVIQQFIDQFERIASGILAAASGIVGITLLVGGIGIMNIMLVSVSERTREIGLRKSLGARPEVILLQFLIEAVVLCLSGAVVGLLVAQGLVFLITKIPDANMEGAAIPSWAIGVAVGFSAFIGIVFGMFPAIKAARLNPIDALRHE